MKKMERIFADLFCGRKRGTIYGALIYVYGMYVCMCVPIIIEWMTIETNKFTVSQPFLIAQRVHRKL